MLQWEYLDEDHQPQGMFSWEQIRHLYDDGQLTLESRVRHPQKTDGAWRPLREMKVGEKHPQLPPIPLNKRVDRRWLGTSSRHNSLEWASNICFACAGITMLGTGLVIVDISAGALMFVATPVLYFLGSAGKVLNDIQQALLVQETLLHEQRQQETSD
jgi:hypothetical protein